MRLGAGAGTRIIELVGVRLGLHNEVGQALDGRIRLDDQDVGGVDEFGYRHEVAKRVVGQIFKQRRIDCDRGGGQQQRVSVGGRMRGDVARMRAMMSVGPPGANGTISVIGRSGQAARAEVGKPHANSATTTMQRAKSLGTLPLPACGKRSSSPFPAWRRKVRAGEWASAQV